eukprot:6167597-Prymnesium_polylepis.1
MYGSAKKCRNRHAPRRSESGPRAEACGQLRAPADDGSGGDGVEARERRALGRWLRRIDRAPTAPALAAQRRRHPRVASEGGGNGGGGDGGGGDGGEEGG